MADRLTWAQVEAVYQDGYIYGQGPLPTSELQIREEEVVGETWGLGRISHRSPGESDYVNEKYPRTYLYCLDTGVRTLHREFGGRAIWGANFIHNSPVCLAIQSLKPTQP